MSIVTCPRCQRVNPEAAVYCYFDGVALRAGPGVDGSRLPQEFAFPSGRRCRTFPELAQGCREEWSASRDLLKKGTFKQYFATIGRADLAKAALEAAGQDDADIGLATLLEDLPGTQGQIPKLEIQPRRFVVGQVPAGEKRRLLLTVSNQGQGVLQGTVTVSEESPWLRVGEAKAHLSISTPREQKIELSVDTSKLAAGKSYAGRLTVVTNGGIVEVPVRVDAAVHPFVKEPFRGVQTPRELAQKMRGQPKAAVPMLEAGDIGRWFSANGWNYPVAGPQARGVAGVQQFFEAMGLSKAPVVQASPGRVHLKCANRACVRGQILLQTNAKKWIYANVASDSDWLKVVTPAVSGPQQASVAFEIDPSRLGSVSEAKGTLQVTANAGQSLPVQIQVEAPILTAPSRLRSALPNMLVLGIVFILLRLVFQFFIGNMGPVPASEETAFIRQFVLWMWWLGAVFGALSMGRRGSSVRDVIWGVVAGTFAGVAGAATLACVFLLADLAPRLLVGQLLSPDSIHGFLAGLIVLAGWGVLGAGLGALLSGNADASRYMLLPLRRVFAKLCRLCGLSGLASFWFAEDEDDSGRNFVLHSRR